MEARFCWRGDELPTVWRRQWPILSQKCMVLEEILLFSNQSMMKIEKWRKYPEESWRERVVEVGVWRLV